MLLWSFSFHFKCVYQKCPSFLSVKPEVTKRTFKCHFTRTLRLKPMNDGTTVCHLIIKRFDLSWPADLLTALHPIQCLNKPRPQLYAYFHCVVNTHTMNLSVCVCVKLINQDETQHTHTKAWGSCRTDVQACCSATEALSPSTTPVTLFKHLSIKRTFQSVWESFRVTGSVLCDPTEPQLCVRLDITNDILLSVCCRSQQSHKNTSSSCMSKQLYFTST